MLAVGGREWQPGGGRAGAEPQPRAVPDGGLAPPAGVAAQMPDAGRPGDPLARLPQGLRPATAGGSLPRAPVRPKPQPDAGREADFPATHFPLHPHPATPGLMFAVKHPRGTEPGYVRRKKSGRFCPR